MSLRQVRFGLVAALIAALVLLQALALAHRIAHTGTASAHASSAWLDTLFAGHHQGSDCALYDQLLQPHAPVDTTCAATPAFAPPRPTEPHRAWLLALQALGFLARGPPAAA